jgi:hypothetical protein
MEGVTIATISAIFLNLRDTTAADDNEPKLTDREDRTEAEEQALAALP